MKSKFIALSGISASFVAIVLTIGAYVELFDVFSIVLASVFVILPLYIGSAKGCFLTYAVGGVVSLLCGMGNITSIVYPAYFVFFGLYPIVKFIAIKKRFDRRLFTVLGIIWCVITSYLMFFYYTKFLQLELENMPQIVADNVLYFVALFGVVFYFVYDRFIFVASVIENRYLQRIIK